MSSVDSYDYREYDTGKTGEDENGKFKIICITKEIPCDCHPETCCHFDQTKLISYEKKVYLK